MRVEEFMRSHKQSMVSMLLIVEFDILEFELEKAKDSDEVLAPNNLRPKNDILLVLWYFVNN